MDLPGTLAPAEKPPANNGGRYPGYGTSPTVTEYVYPVHATKPDDVGMVEVIFLTEQKARRHAAERSHDFGVLATSVTRYALDALGTRTALAWYVNGTEQPHRKARLGRPYPTDGCVRLGES
jgi:hypothetical protein